MLEALLSQPEGLDEHLAQALGRCQRMDRALGVELSALEKKMHDETSNIPEVARLTTIPAVGERVATMIHARVGDVRRFRSARELASYAGLVPSVWQSDKAHRTGGITKEGSPQLRSVLSVSPKRLRRSGRLLSGFTPCERAARLPWSQRRVTF